MGFYVITQIKTIPTGGSWCFAMTFLHLDLSWFRLSGVSRCARSMSGHDPSRFLIQFSIRNPPIAQRWFPRRWDIISILILPAHSVLFMLLLLLILHPHRSSPLIFRSSATSQLPPGPLIPPLAGAPGLAAPTTSVLCPSPSPCRQSSAT